MNISVRMNYSCALGNLQSTWDTLSAFIFRAHDFKHNSELNFKSKGIPASKVLGSCFERRVGSDMGKENITPKG